MAKDLYEILGVAKGATFTQVKKAYHKRANESHPDKGGDNEKMAEINTAYDVLSDPEKRRIYDETGYYETRTLTSLEEALALLAEVYSGMLGKYGEWFPYIDIIKEAKEHIDKSRETCTSDKTEAEQYVAVLKYVGETLVTDSKENLIAEMLSNLAGGPQKTVAAAHRFLIVSQKAMELLEQYHYTPMPMTDEQKEAFEEFLNPKRGPLDMLKDLMDGNK